MQEALKSPGYKMVKIRLNVYDVGGGHVMVRSDHCPRAHASAGDRQHCAARSSWSWWGVPRGGALALGSRPLSHRMHARA